MDAIKQKTRVATLSVATNTMLVIFKTIVGIITGSVAIVSEAVHSGMDLIAAIIALIAVRISSKSPDDDHPFGHGKAESISAFIEALLIFFAAIWIIYESVRKVLSPHPIETVGWGVLVMLFSSAINLVISQLLFKVGHKTESAALIADGWHLRTDVYTSAGVMFGLGCIWMGHYIIPAVNLAWIDPLVAIGVAMLILRAAYRLTISAVKDLMDTSTPAEEQKWIIDYMTKLFPTVRSFHRLRTRKSGANRFINFHMVVDSAMTVQESHEFSDKIVGDFKQYFPHADVILHIEPCDGNCTNTCLSGCMLKEDEREEIRKRFPSSG